MPGPRRRGAAPAPGGTWVGEVPIDQTADDWEPAIATDPSAPWVYVLTTRYGQAKPCPGNCPVPWISLSISRDGGATFPTTKPLCACKGSGQFDPIIEVVPGKGWVYALYMNGFNVLFTKSSDHGATWSAPAKVYGSVSWNDKPIIAVSDDGRTCTPRSTARPGATRGSPSRTTRARRGRRSSSSIRTAMTSPSMATSRPTAPSTSANRACSTAVAATRARPRPARSTSTSSSRATTAPRWIDKVVGQTQPGLACTAAGCTPDFYLGHHAVTADAGGNLVFLYDGATTAGGKQSIYATRSTDKGATWSTPSVVSAAGEEATLPMIESRGNGIVRAVWMETTGGGNVDAWNAMSRLSTDGGATWGTPSRVSDATSGAAYKTPAGFAEVYGDYGEIAFTNLGKAVAVWGEGASYTGPGGVWLNREP